MLAGCDYTLTVAMEVQWLRLLVQKSKYHPSSHGLKCDFAEFVIPRLVRSTGAVNYQMRLRIIASRQMTPAQSEIDGPSCCRCRSMANRS